MTAFKGCVPVAPDAVRVWRGFRNPDVCWQDFVTFLAETLFPTEATWRPYFGLTCYVAGIKLEAANAHAPDEFALIFYESKQVYEAGLRTVAGRIYPLFPVAKFGGGHSQYPVRLGEAVTTNTAYYIFDDHVDWYQGSVSCLLGTVPKAVDRLCASVHAVLAALRQHPPTGLDGLIAMVDENKDGSGYLLCWTHWAEGTAPAGEPLAQLAGLVTVVLNKDAAEPMTVAGGFYDLDVCIKLAPKGDQLLRLQFLRRRLAVENGHPVGGPLK
jgi:hypothetical protein